MVKWMMTLPDGKRLFFWTLEELSRFVAVQDLTVEKIERIPEGYVFKETDRGVTEYMNVNISFFTVDKTTNGIGWAAESMIRTIKYPDCKTCYRDTVDPVAMFKDKEDVLGQLSEFVGKLWAKNYPNG